MICWNCKNESDEDARFCKYCGVKLDKNYPQYNTVPIWKIVVLVFLSFGLYNYVWSFNLWKQAQKEYSHNISPFWRAVFFNFTNFMLFPRINNYITNPQNDNSNEIDDMQENAAKRYINDSKIKPIPAIFFASVVFVFNWISNFLYLNNKYSLMNISDLIIVILCIIALIPMFVIQIKINNINERYNIPALNDKWTWATTGYVALWLFSWFFLLIILILRYAGY